MRARRFALVLAVVSLVSLVGCSEDDSEPTGTTGPEILAPPPVGEGVQFSMSHTIAPGVEGEWCKFVVAPTDDDLWVSHNQTRYTDGSHHFLLYETEYDVIPTEKEDGTVVDTSGVFDCSDGASNGWRITRVIGGSQNGTGETILAFPEGVALRVRAGAVLLMNAHYLNATGEPLEPQIRINLWTRPAESITTPGDVLFLYNPFIRVPARGQARARYRCPVHTDITVTTVQSHMHARGVGYSAQLVGGRPFFETDAWTDVPTGVFEQGLQVPAGSTFDYHCDYDNPEARDVYQGPRTTDEMCMLVGTFYPADENTASCLDAEGRFTGEWVGEGTATCAATLQCLANLPEGGDVIRAVSDCMLAADPAVSAEASALLVCFANAENPATDCTPQINTCAAM